MLSMVTASLSFAVSETKLFKPLRESVPAESFVGRLLSCGFCFGHWVALALVVVYRPKLLEAWWPVDYLLTAMIVAWLGGVQWAGMCLLMKLTDK